MQLGTFFANKAKLKRLFAKRHRFSKTKLGSADDSLVTSHGDGISRVITTQCQTQRWRKCGRWLKHSKAPVQRSWFLSMFSHSRDVKLRAMRACCGSCRSPFVFKKPEPESWRPLTRFITWQGLTESLDLGPCKNSNLCLVRSALRLFTLFLCKSLRVLNESKVPEGSKRCVDWSHMSYGSKMATPKWSAVWMSSSTWQPDESLDQRVYPLVMTNIAM